MFNGKASGGVTPEVWNQLEKVYADVTKLVDLIGLEYTDDDEYVCNNTDQVDPEWCDEDLLSSLDTLRMDLGYYLGK